MRKFWVAFSVVVLTLVMLFASASPALAATTVGPNYPGTGVSVDHGSGNPSWANPGYVTADDLDYATVTISASGQSDYLQATNFGFSIPSEATILGIQVTIMRMSSSNAGDNSIDDHHVELIKGGSITGDDKASGTDWPTSMGTASYGSASDPWGTSWTPAQINASNFGVSLTCENESFGSSRTAYVDYIRVSVTYTMVAGPNYPSTASQTNYDASSNGGANGVEWFGSTSNNTTIGTDISNNDSAYAYTSPELGTSGDARYSDYLNATNFGFSIPSGATIEGIEVTIERRAEDDDDVYDAIVRLLKAGSLVGSNYARTSDDWNDNDWEVDDYGGPSDLWGTTWSAADINNANFGVALVCWNDDTSNTRWARVDYIRITVYYTGGSLTPTTTALVSGTNPSTYGSSVTFTATVTPNPGASGTVQFKDGGSNLGSPVALNSSGVAAYTTSVSELTAASHSITAEYSGDSTYAGSTSNTVNQVVNQKNLTVSGITADNKVYDGTTAATLNTGGAALVGVVAGDTVTLNTGSAVGTFSDPNVGTGITVTISGLTIGGADAANYTLTQPTTTADIAPRPLTIQAERKYKNFGEADPSLTYLITSGSLVAGDGLTGGLTRVPGELPGTYPILQGSLTAGPNYTITYIGNNFSIYTNATPPNTTTINPNATEPAGIIPGGSTTTTPATTTPATTTTPPTTTTAGAPPTTNPKPPQVYVTLPGGTSLSPTGTSGTGGGETNWPAMAGIGGGSLLALFFILFFGLRRSRKDERK